jgi:hypothetical protein
MDIKNLVSVIVNWEDDSHASIYLVPKVDLKKFVIAQVKLHFEPGVNPHNGNSTKRISSIWFSELELHGPYWWSTPDLGVNYDPAGAKVIPLNGGMACAWTKQHGLKV